MRKYTNRKKATMAPKTRTATPASSNTETTNSIVCLISITYLQTSWIHTFFHMKKANSTRKADAIYVRELDRQTLWYLVSDTEAVYMTDDGLHRGALKWAS